MDLILAVLAALAAAPLAVPLHRWLGPRVGWLLAAVPAGLAAFFLSKAPAVAGGTAFRESVPWVPSLGVDFAFRLDGLSLVLALLVTVVGALVLVYAGRYLAGDPRAGGLLGLLLAFTGSMLGLVLADDLVNLFVFWEATSVTSFLLVGHKRKEPEARAAALQALLVTGGGGLALLAGLVLLGQLGGTLSLTELGTRAGRLSASGLYPVAAALVLVGAGAKSAQVPLHFWLPSAMAAPTPVSAYLHSAAMVKAGIYLIGRLTPVLGGTPVWGVSLVVVGGLTMVWGAYLALRHSDYKLVLAGSTVSALGTLVLLLGIGTAAAVGAALVLLIAHALYKGALFMVAGAVEHATGTRDLDQLGGLRGAMPFTAGVAGLAALSLAGLGPLLSFVGKELFLEALLGAPIARQILVPAGLLASMMLVAVAGIVGLRPFAGQRRETLEPAHEPPVELLAGPAVLAVGGLVLGFVPGLLTDWLVREATGAVLGAPAALELTLWHGFTPALGLTALSLAGGLVLYQGWRHVHRGHETLARLVPVSAQRTYDAAMVGLQRAADRVTRAVQPGSPRTYLLTVVSIALALLAAAAAWIGWPEAVSVGEPGLVTLVLAATIATGALVVSTTESRLVAPLGLGIAGYGAALLFVAFGAPDLAMTQILFETLGVIVFLLVLERIPNLDVRTTDVDRARDALLALGVGAVVTVLVLVSAGPAPSALADYFGRASYVAAHGRNVVNVILVDFRGLDTLGEVAVIGAAGIGVYALLTRSAEGRP